jgi:hypothetical protein
MCCFIISQAQNIKFNYTYGNMPYNYGRRIIETGDKGFMIMGNVTSNTGNSNIAMLRIDSTGLLVFQKSLGGQSLYWANDFIRTTDKGYLIAGLTLENPDKGYDMLLMKTDSNANIIWEKSIGGDGWDIANAVIETKDNAYLIAGLTYSYGAANENMYIVKTTSDGDTIWTKTFGGDSSDYATSLEIMFDSTYLIGGATNSFGYGSFDGYLLNLDVNGDTLWTKTYGEDKEDIIYSIKQTPDTGFVFVGSTMSYDAVEHESWLMRYDKNGNYVWKLPEFWTIGPGDDVSYHVNIDDSARYLITGYTTGAGNGGKELSIAVMGDFVDFKCSLTAGSFADDAGYYASQTSDGGYIIIGEAEGLGIGIVNMYVLKFGNDCSFNPNIQHILGVDEQINENSNNKGKYYISPTCSDGIFYLHFGMDDNFEKAIIDVSDVMGRKILTDNIASESYGKYTIDLTKEASGLYIVTVTNETKRISIKLVKNSR